MAKEEQTKPCAVVKTAGTEAQRRFWQSPARTRILLGGLGSGKSRAGNTEILRQPPGTTVLVVAPNYKTLVDATVSDFMELYSPLVAVHQKVWLTTKLINGTKILWRSADNPDGLRAMNAGALWLEEGALISEEAYKMAIGRVRKAPGRIWVTTTPRGKDNWLFRLATSERPDVEVIHAPTTSNTWLPPEYIDSLKLDYSSAQQLQELEGLFVDMEGQRVKREWFRYGLPPREFPVSIGVDLAISTKSTADYTAISATCRDPETSRIYVLDVQRDRLTFDSAKRFIESVAEKWGASVVNVESVAFQAAMVQELNRTTNLNVKAVRVSTDKVSRFGPLEARMEQGLVYFAPDLPDYVEDELLSFPGGQHDDVVDSLVLACGLTPRRAIRLLA